MKRLEMIFKILLEDLIKNTNYNINDVKKEANKIFKEVDYRELIYVILILYTNSLKEKIASFFDDKRIKNYVLSFDPDIIYLKEECPKINSFTFSNFTINDIKTKKDAITFIELYTDDIEEEVPHFIKKLFI